MVGRRMWSTHFVDRFAPISSRQVEVLQWIADGCQDGVMTGCLQDHGKGLAGQGPLSKLAYGRRVARQGHGCRPLLPAAWHIPAARVARALPGYAESARTLSSSPGDHRSRRK